MSSGDPRGYRDDSPASRERGFRPCCGYHAIAPDTPGSYEVCPACYTAGWNGCQFRRGTPGRLCRSICPAVYRLGDLVAFYDRGYESQYDHPSLRAARRNFRESGTVSREAVGRTCDPAEPRAPNRPYG